MIPPGVLQQQATVVVAEGYPLDDDGSAASAFAIAHIATTAPVYHAGSFTYNDALPSTAAALPKLANLLTSQAIPVTDVRRGCQLRFDTAPANYSNMSLGMLFSNSGSVVGSAFIGIADTLATVPIVVGSGGIYEARTDPAEGYRVTAIVDGVSNRIWFITGEGVALAGPAMVGADAVTFFVMVSNNGETANGQAMSFTFFPDAAEMTAVFPADVLDWEDNPCPIDEDFEYPEIPPEPTQPVPVSAAVAADGQSITLIIDQDITGTMGLGFTFSVTSGTRTFSTATETAPGEITFAGINAPINPADTVQISYSSGTGNIAGAVGGLYMGSFSNLAVTNGTTAPNCVLPLSSGSLTISNNDTTFSCALPAGDLIATATGVGVDASTDVVCFEIDVVDLPDSVDTGESVNMQTLLSMVGQSINISANVNAINGRSATLVTGVGGIAQVFVGPGPFRIGVALDAPNSQVRWWIDDAEAASRPYTPGVFTLKYALVTTNDIATSEGAFITGTHITQASGYTTSFPAGGKDFCGNVIGGGP